VDLFFDQLNINIVNLVVKFRAVAMILQIRHRWYKQPKCNRFFTSRDISLRFNSTFECYQSNAAADYANIIILYMAMTIRNYEQNCYFD